MLKSLINNKPSYLLAIILLIYVMAWFLLKPVWPWGDDFWYAYSANRFLKGDIMHGYSAFQHRMGIYVPVGYLFKIFGVTPYSIALWPLLAGVSTIIVTYAALKKFANPELAIIACFLIATNTTQITHSIALYPDGIISFYAICAVFIVYYGRMGNAKEQFLQACLLNIVLFAAFVTKESIILVAPFLICTALRDKYKGRVETYLFWKYAIAGFLIGAVIVSGLFYFKTGDPFHQIKSILYHNGHDVYYMNRWKDAIEDIKAANSSNIISWLISKLGYIFILIYSIPVLFRSNTNGFLKYIAMYALFVLVELIVFFHIERYAIIFLLERFWMFLIVPLSILTASTLYENGKREAIFISIAFLVIAVYCYFSTSFVRALIFLSFSALPIIAGHINRNFRLVTLAGFIALMGYFLYRNTNYLYPRACTGNLIKEKLEEFDKQGPTIIVTDDHLAFKHIIYNQFKKYENLTFISFEKADSASALKKILIVNEEERGFSYFVNREGAQWRPIFMQTPVYIYEYKNKGDRF